MNDRPGLVPQWPSSRGLMCSAVRGPSLVVPAGRCVEAGKCPGIQEDQGAIMKAAVVTSFTSPLEIQELPVPEPGPGEVLVRMETSGLCHTDIHAAHGDWPVKPTPPFIPGHEGIGYVEKLGPDVTNRAVGDRVAIAWLGYACGECAHCIDGWETLCESQHNSGYSVNGSFAEYAVVSAA